MMQNFEKLSEVIKLIRQEMSPELPIQQLAILIEIHRAEGITTHELGRRLGISSGAMSRSIMALSAYIRGGERKGLELVATRPHTIDRRRTSCFLTDKGHDIMARISRLLT